MLAPLPEGEQALPVFSLLSNKNIGIGPPIQKGFVLVRLM